MDISSALWLAAGALVAAWIVYRFARRLGWLLRLVGWMCLVGAVAPELGLVTLPDGLRTDPTRLALIGAGCWLAGAVIHRVLNRNWPVPLRWVLGDARRGLGRRTNRPGGPGRPAGSGRPGRIGRPGGRGGRTPGDVVYTTVRFEDTKESKDRPVVIVGSRDRQLQALEMTSQERPERAGPYSGPWCTAQKPRSWVKLDRVVPVSARNIRRDAGRMSGDDFAEVLSAYQRRQSTGRP